MENTNCGKECAFVKAGFCENDTKCPHFIQTLWQKEGDPNPKIVFDCYPKKFALEQNHLLHRFLAMQSVTEELRNKINNLENSIKQLCFILNQKISDQEQKLIFTDKENLKSIE